MKRIARALIGLFCAASLLAACGSNSPTSPTTPADKTPASFEPSPAITLTAQASKPIQATPSPTETASITPVPEVSFPPYSPALQPPMVRAGASGPAAPTATGLSLPDQPCTLADTCEWLRVTWREPNPSGVTIRIYALTACLHSATATKPQASCVDAGDTIPKADLLILGTALASAGAYSFELEFPIGEGFFGFGLLPGNGPIVQAILLQAVGPGGGSPFAIVATTGDCYGCIL